MFFRVLFSFFLLIAASQGQSWVGTWSDGLAYGGYGGNFYLCADGNVVQGVYSEVGYVYGVASGLSLVGNWFEPGSTYSDGMPTRGTFNLTLSSDGYSFSGYYYYEGSEQTKLWFSTKTSALSPSSAQCFFSSASAASNLQARWISSYSINDICLSTTLSFYNASYSYSNINGYSTGECFDLGHICTGEWYEDEEFGVYLFVLGNDNTLFETWWTGYTDDINYSNKNVDGAHAFNTDQIRYSDPEDCSLYEFFQTDFQNMDSGASQLSGALALLSLLFTAYRLF